MSDNNKIQFGAIGILAANEVAVGFHRESWESYTIEMRLAVISETVMEMIAAQKDDFFEGKSAKWLKEQIQLGYDDCIKILEGAGLDAFA